MKIFARLQRLTPTHQSTTVMFQQKTWNPSLVRVSLSLTVDRKRCNSNCIGQVLLAAEVPDFALCPVPTPVDVVLHDRFEAAKLLRSTGRAHATVVCRTF